MRHYGMTWGRLLLGSSLMLAPGAARAQSDGMLEYHNDKFGFTIRVPAAVFEPGKTRNPEAGSLWISHDRQARLVAAGQLNESGETLLSYRQYLIKETYPDATFDYAPVHDSWFVLSGTNKNNQMFYERVVLTCDGRYIYGWQMLYPASQRATYDRVVETIHRGYRPGRGPNGNCQ